jgi:hypothetical protein
MTSNRIIPLNNVAADFSVEELEPRMEMQMLGLGTDPGIVVVTSRSITIIWGTIWTEFGTWYFT